MLIKYEKNIESEVLIQAKLNRNEADEVDDKAKQEPSFDLHSQCRRAQKHRSESQVSIISCILSNLIKISHDPTIQRWSFKVLIIR